MSNTNNKIPTVSLNKSDICSNIEHPIAYQELNPSSQNIPQTRCAIYLINRPQPYEVAYVTEEGVVQPKTLNGEWKEGLVNGSQLKLYYENQLPCNSR
jgi:hypothetical protein